MSERGAGAAPAELVQRPANRAQEVRGRRRPDASRGSAAGAGSLPRISPRCLGSMVECAARQTIGLMPLLQMPRPAVEDTRRHVFELITSTTLRPVAAADRVAV
jgi:hypothetical protein